jgi:two-component system sensor histidine kinase BaeS
VARVPRSVSGRTGVRPWLPMLATVLVAVLVTMAVAALVTDRVVRDRTLEEAHDGLGRLADAAAAVVDTGDQRALLVPAGRLLRALGVDLGVVTGAARVVGDADVRDALSRHDVVRLLAGRSLSGGRTADGSPVLVEGRPTRTGGLVLLRERRDALAARNHAVRSVLRALLVGGAAALVAALLLARGPTRPGRPGRPGRGQAVAPTLSRAPGSRRGSRASGGPPRRAGSRSSGRCR